MSPTQRSLKKLREEGYLCEIVEKTIPKCFIKKDLFGFVDILCLKDEEILGVQTTSGANFANRVQKIKNHENLEMVKMAGIKISVHGWRKLKGKWACKEEIIK